MKLREILQWLAKLLPQQKAKGDGNFQAGRVDGDLNNNQNTTHQTIYNTYYVMTSDSPAPAAANESRPAPLVVEPTVSDAEKKPATVEQLEVLRLMRSSERANSYAEVFMQKHFKTSRVKRLNDLQCRRTKGYVLARLKREAEQAPLPQNARWG